MSVSIDVSAESVWSPGKLSASGSATSQHIHLQPNPRPQPLELTPIQPAASETVCEECKVGGCAANEPPTQMSCQPNPCLEAKTKTSFLVRTFFCKLFLQSACIEAGTPQPACKPLPPRLPSPAVHASLDTCTAVRFPL